MNNPISENCINNIFPLQHIIYSKYRNSTMKIFLVILLILTLQPSGVCLQTKVEGNLIINVRQGAPWPNLPCYTKDLKESQAICYGEYTVRTARHHIVPFDTLSTFWNRIITNPQHLSSGLTNAWTNMISQYNKSFPNPTENVVNLMKSMQSGDLVHNSTKPAPEDWNEFAEYWEWEGANLMIGPSVRSDDPGNGFEKNAFVIVGKSTFSNLDTMNTFMNNYRQTYTMKQVKSFANTFSNIVRKTGRPYPLKAADWTLKNGRYKINVPKALFTANLQGEDNSISIGDSFKISELNMLAETLTGGYPVWEDLPDDCIKSADLFTTIEMCNFYDNTASFYHSVATGSSLSVDVEFDFTLGVTLEATTQSVSSQEHKVRGMTMKVQAESTKHFLESKCLNEAKLTESLVKEFEELPIEVKDPWMSNQWIAYELFLESFGSHIVTEVIFGSSLYQHCFSEESSTYTQNEFNLKACADFAGSTPVGKIGLKTCAQYSQKDIDAASSLETSSMLIIRGGSSETRSQLYNERTGELISKFLAEANQTRSPIGYRLMPIWQLLQLRYFHSDHFAKALNLEAYYTGYLNFGCPYERSPTGVELQKFVNNSASTPDYPIYECIIAPQGCHDNDDCDYRDAFWCECNGDSCIHHYDRTLDTGSKRKYAEIFAKSGWGWHGCTLSGLSCWCTDPDNNWIPIWSQSTGNAQFITALRAKLASERLSLESETRKNCEIVHFQYRTKF